MAILKKPKPRECDCVRLAGGSATGVSMLEGAGRTLKSGPEDIKLRREMTRVQLAIMQADLRLRNAQADLAEVTAERARAELQRDLALGCERSARK